MTRETHSLEAVLPRKLKKARALKAIQGAVGQHPLLILSHSSSITVGPKSSISKYFRRVCRRVKGFLSQRMSVFLHQ